ncbi:MAG: aldo/keto reductase [Caldilineaceae bacterium]
MSRKHIMESIDKTLTRFGTDYIDIYFCHRYDAETPVEEVVRAMDDPGPSGRSALLGHQRLEAAQIEDAVGTARQYNCYLPQVEQLRATTCSTAISSRRIMPTAAKHGMGITVFSPLRTRAS